MRRHPKSSAAVALLAALAILTAACGGSDAEDAEAETRTGTSVRIPAGGDGSSTTADAAVDGTADGEEAAGDRSEADDPEAGAESTATSANPADDPDTLPTDALRLVEVATAEFPTTLISRPGSADLWVAEREGQVRQLRRDDDGFELLADPTLDIADLVGVEGEGGLLGLTFSPDGRLLYVSYTGNSGESIVAEYAMDGDRADADSARILLTVEQPFSNHNGGQIEWGPDDLLYVALGDGGNGGDPLNSGQDTSTLLGAILRLDPENPGGEAAYGIPADNPFADGERGRPEIWLYGVRNPWRFSFDRDTGDLWIGDVGQNAVEEITFLPADGGSAGRGANLGWRLVEGDQPFDGGTPPPDHAAPIHTYGREGGACSVTGGYVYRGERIPELSGAYLFADYCVGQILALRALDDGSILIGDVVTDRSVGRIVSFGEDEDGEIYVLAPGGSINRLEAG